MSEARRELLTVGAFFIILVLAIVLYAAGTISLEFVIPIVLALLGAWMIVLAIMRSSKPVKYERGAFSTLAIGLFLIAIGGAWYLTLAINWLYGVALLLLVFAILAVAAALKRR